MRFELYFAPGACSFVPHTLLEAAGEAFEPRLLKLHKGEQRSLEFLALNPNGQVPLLIDNGTPITQIVSICLHLEEAFPQQNWLPASGAERAQAISWLMWMNNVAHPTFTHIFMPAKFTPDEGAQASVKAHNLTLFGEVLAKMDAEIARRGTAYWLGGHFSPLDAYSLTLARWGSMVGLNPQNYPALWQLVGRVAALPPVARVIERERLTLNLFSPNSAS